MWTTKSPGQLRRFCLCVFRWACLPKHPTAVLTTLGSWQISEYRMQTHSRGNLSAALVSGVWTGRWVGWEHSIISPTRNHRALKGSQLFVCKGSSADQIRWRLATLKTVTVIILLISKIAGYWFGCFFNLAYGLSAFLFNKCWGGENPSDCIWKHMCTASLGKATLAVVISCCCLGATLFHKPGMPLPAYSEASSYLLFQMVWPVLTFRNELNPGLHWTRSARKLFPF